MSDTNISVEKGQKRDNNKGGDYVKVLILGIEVMKTVLTGIWDGLFHNI